MSPQMENTLIEALDLLEQGTPIVKILASYPDLSEELRPYLITAVDLTQLAKPSTVAAQQRSKDGFLRQAAALQAERAPTSRSSWLQRALAIGLAALLFLLVSSSMLAFASAEAIPGDTLYGTKLVLEQLQLTYSANPETAAAMIERFHRERLDEAAALLALNRHEPVTFSGTVEELSADRWLVEGIPVAITPATVVPDGIATGFLVQITGTTGEGLVTADRVEVVRGHLPEPALNDPTPPAQHSPSATPAPASEPIVTPPGPALTQPDDGAESNLPAGVLTPASQDDSLEMPSTGDRSPGEDGGHNESEADDDSSSRPGDNSDQQDDSGDQSDDSNDQQDDSSDQQDDSDDQSDDSRDQNESEEESGGNSGSGGDERESEDGSQEEKDEEDRSGKTGEDDKDNSGGDEEDSKDSDDGQSEEEEGGDGSADTGDDAKEEDSHDGNSGKGSNDESEDEEKRD